MHVFLSHGKQGLLKACFAESVIGSGFTKYTGRTDAKKEGRHQRTGLDKRQECEPKWNQFNRERGIKKRLSGCKTGGFNNQLNYYLVFFSTQNALLQV